MGSPSMKILVSGCSLTAGWGFDGGPESPEIWPNILAQKLNAEITNVGRSGYDNTGIFLNALEKCTASKYDLVLLQITRLNRVVVRHSPAPERAKSSPPRRLHHRAVRVFAARTAGLGGAVNSASAIGFISPFMRISSFSSGLARAWHPSRRSR